MERIYKAFSKTLDRQFPVQVLAVAPRQFQLPVSHQCVDFKKVIPGCPRTAIMADRFTGLPKAGCWTQCTVDLAEIVKPDKSRRQALKLSAQFRIAAEIPKQSIPDSVARHTAKLLFHRRYKFRWPVSSVNMQQNRENSGETTYGTRQIHTFHDCFAAVSLHVDQQPGVPAPCNQALSQSSEQQIVDLCMMEPVRISKQNLRLLSRERCCHGRGSGGCSKTTGSVMIIDRQAADLFSRTAEPIRTFILRCA